MIFAVIGGMMYVIVFGLFSMTLFPLYAWAAQVSYNWPHILLAFFGYLGFRCRLNFHAVRFLLPMSKHRTIDKNIGWLLACHQQCTVLHMLHPPTASLIHWHCHMLCGSLF